MNLRILYLAHRIPYPPDKGEKTRCYHQLACLSARHEIDLFCFADSIKEAKGREALQAFCRTVYVETLPPYSGYKRVARSLFSDVPASVGYYNSPSMYEAVRKALGTREYDLIFVYCSSVAQFVPLPSKTPTVIDFVDADSEKWKQYARYSSFPLSWLYAREGKALARYEKRIARHFNLSIVTTPREAQELGGGGCPLVEVVANGVTPPPKLNPQDLPSDIRRLRPYVLFVGTMSYRPNADAAVHFAKDIFPLLRGTHPDLNFLIVGRDPTTAVLKLRRLPGVIVTGSVPDIHSYLAGATATVAPFRIAQGVQNKVLESLVAGIPVVLTSRPAKAFASPATDHLLIADTPEAFANLVRSVFVNTDLRRRCLDAAPHLQQVYSWSRNLVRLQELVESVAISPHGAIQDAPSLARVR